MLQAMPSAAFRPKTRKLALWRQLAFSKALAVQSSTTFCPNWPHHWPCEPRGGETASDPSLDPSLGQPAASDPIPQGPQGPCFAPAPQQARRRLPSLLRHRGRRCPRKPNVSQLRSPACPIPTRRRRRSRSSRVWSTSSASASARAPQPPRPARRGIRRRRPRHGRRTSTTRSRSRSTAITIRTTGAGSRCCSRAPCV